MTENNQLQHNNNQSNQHSNSVNRKKEGKIKNNCNLMNSAVPFVNCVQIKTSNPRGINEQ